MVHSSCFDAFYAVTVNGWVVNVTARSSKDVNLKDKENKWSATIINQSTKI